MDTGKLWDKPWYPVVNIVRDPWETTRDQHAVLMLLWEILQPARGQYGNPYSSNYHMVDTSDLTIIAPKEAQPVLRSGTWATFRYSMGQLKPTVLIQPDGTTIAYSGDGKEIMKTNVVSLYNGAATPSATWTDNSTGTAIEIHESANGYFAFYGSGTWDSGTAKLQVSPDDSGNVWLDVTGASLTADGYKIVQVFGRRARAVLSGVAGAAASLALKVAGVQSGVTRTNS